jgi:hypothetical protein
MSLSVCDRRAATGAPAPPPGPARVARDVGRRGPAQGGGDLTTGLTFASRDPTASRADVADVRPCLPDHATPTALCALCTL